MAEGAVTMLLEQLKEVGLGHRDMISGAAHEFEQLQEEFELLKAFLKETKNDIQYVKLKGRIREVVYEVEDAIDTCLTTNQSSLAIAKEVKSIREDKVRPLIDAISSFPYKVVQSTADEAESMEVPQATRERDTPIRKKIRTDLKDSEDIITSYLMEKTKHLDVIFIVGMPGLGKTTVAWNVYQSNVISFHFPILIWVHISQYFNTRNVFLQILEKFMLSSQDTSYLDDAELSQTVRACLKKEKLLLVLDDVWTVDDFMQIRDVLPFKNCESKVLVTTRHVAVGRASSLYREPHMLRLLTHEESWMLLQLEVFGDQEGCPEELSDIGKYIAHMCYGQALVIVVIGGILADQLMRSPSKALHEWKKLEENMRGALRSDNWERNKSVLALAYQALPDELRACFVFLGVFPEDYEISADMLCGMWISEGFVPPRNGESVEVTAEENMKDLIRRNLLNVEKTNHMGKVKTCRVHSTIREVCISISKDEHLFREIRPQDSEVLNSRRLCLSSDFSGFLSENPRGPHVRSLLCFHEQPVYLEPELISVIPNVFPKLRILESKCIVFNQFPARLTKLLHLRYLTLYIQTLEILPEAIARLWNLQSLVLETKSRSTTMKANVWNMFRLRRLKTRAVIVLDNEWEGEAGANLHTLNRLASESCTEAVSRRAKNLKTLGISGKLASIFQTNFLKNLDALEKLKLENRISNGLPQRNCFPRHLKSLTLTKTGLGWKHMSTLAMIKTLEVLKLKDNAFIGALWRVPRYDFPSLKLLIMVKIYLFQWEVPYEALPRLRILVVNDCENLREIPECLGERLERLEIYRVRHSLVESAVKIAKTYEGKPKGKHGVEFNLTIGAAWTTQVKHQSNIFFS